MPTTNRPTRLHVINALVTGHKQIAQQALTASHRSWAPETLTGVHRDYRPLNEDGQTLPSESKRVQLSASKSIEAMAEIVGKEFDLEFAQDRGNSQARADVVVDGTVVLADVPVTFLLRLEKWLVDLRTYVAGLPVLDSAVAWHWDEAREVWATDPVETFRTIKEPQVLVKWAPPTDKFTQPAQTEVIFPDVSVGIWSTVKLSGALPAEVKRLYQARVGALVDAVKVAREAANATELPDNLPKAGKSVFDFLFGTRSA